MWNASIIVRPLIGAAGLLASTLGVLIWIGSPFALIPLDMLLAIVVMLALLVLAALAARAGVREGLVGLVVSPGPSYQPGDAQGTRVLVADTRSRGGPSSPRHEPTAIAPGLSGWCRSPRR